MLKQSITELFGRGKGMAASDDRRRLTAKEGVWKSPGVLSKFIFILTLCCFFQSNFYLPFLPHSLCDIPPKHDPQSPPTQKKTDNPTFALRPLRERLWREKGVRENYQWWWRWRWILSCLPLRFGGRRLFMEEDLFFFFFFSRVFPQSPSKMVKWAGFTDGPELR